MSEHNCRTEAETPHNSPSPHLLVPQSPAGTPSLSLAPHPRGMFRPPAMPRPPTSRRPHSVVRPTSTSRPPLVPHPHSAQRVRAGRLNQGHAQCLVNQGQHDGQCHQQELTSRTERDMGKALQSGQHARVCKKITKEKG